MRRTVSAAAAAVVLVACAPGPDRRIAEIAHAQLGITAVCRQDGRELYWPAYGRNLPTFSCNGRRRGWCLVASPRRRTVVDVTRFMYAALNRATADWSARPACLRWPDVDRLRPPGGDPAVANLPARLYRR